MNARDELARDIFLADNTNAPAGLMEKEWDENPSNYSYAHGIAEGLIAKGYSKPRQVSTVEELDALAVGSVVLSDAYRYMVHGGADCGWPVSFQKWGGGDWHRGARSSDTHPDNFLPATVLYEARP